MSLWSRRKSLAIPALILVALTLSFGAGRATADQPAMQTALDHLRAAERALEGATNDKGGHRQNALEHTRKAIAETEKGMRFDRRH